MKKKTLKENTKSTFDTKQESSTKALPCPHGRIPIGGQDGWKHCPHCLGLNKYK